jgi:hypothetical protein
LDDAQRKRLLGCHLVDQHHHVFWQSAGLARQAHAQPVTYFLANRGITNALELTIIPNNWPSHNVFLSVRAITKRTSRIIARDSPFRRQEASKFGQTCCEQFAATGRMASRSPFANGTVSFASS